jgi:hypothetical protein
MRPQSLPGSRPTKGQNLDAKTSQKAHFTASEASRAELQPFITSSTGSKKRRGGIRYERSRAEQGPAYMEAETSKVSREETLTFVEAASLETCKSMVVEPAFRAVKRLYGAVKMEKMKYLDAELLALGSAIYPRSEWNTLLSHGIRYTCGPITTILFIPFFFSWNRYPLPAAIKDLNRFDDASV